MSESKPPLLGRAWSVVWLIIVGTIAIWFGVQLLTAIWAWLLLIVVHIGAGLAIYAWLRFRRDRW